MRYAVAIWGGRPPLDLFFRTRRACHEKSCGVFLSCLYIFCIRRVLYWLLQSFPAGDKEYSDDNAPHSLKGQSERHVQASAAPYRARSSEEVFWPIPCRRHRHLAARTERAIHVHMRLACLRVVLQFHPA